MEPLSTIVVTHRGGALLGRCLDALMPQLDPGEPVWVVVSARDGAADLGPCLNRRLRLLPLGRNVGFARAANAGIERTRRGSVLLLNDDTRPLPGFVAALRYAAVRPGLYQPRILLADGTGRLDNAGHGLFPDGFNRALGREDQDGPAFDEPGEVGACSGAAILVHREVLDAVGPFDEDFEAFGEDVDLSLRARRRGFPLRYVPQARVEHQLGATYGRWTRRKVYLVERNRLRAAARSLPWSALATMPLWTSARVASLGFAAGLGRGMGARVAPGASLAALAGIASGLLHLPEALGKRREDAPAWALGEREMWVHLWRHRASWLDLWR